ncbi:hypothetical protein QE374_002073 [Microbacterium sp. SORGH_AS428]|uniref:hypothetical protein n=1 Tax=Microbacterium sp. SORGH_AS_0428 TaxID=3041788 RepID=UPI00285A288C|nr:hypothetical protein [Microbacterium sp. SORGH_AS_0428]MDR6200164.1 hypothetical protein [Microbacterium sp. SORGH_AS_0428]
MIEVATNELFSLDGKEVSMQMVYGGDYDYPGFVEFETPSIESAMIAAIDQNTAWVLDERVGARHVRGPGNARRCRKESVQGPYRKRVVSPRSTNGRETRSLNDGAATGPRAMRKPPPTSPKQNPRHVEARRGFLGPL